VPFVTEGGPFVRRRSRVGAFRRHVGATGRIVFPWRCVDHGADTRYLDSNNGAVFMIWDRLFGTTTPRFGLTTPLETRNPVRIHLAGYASIRSILSRATTLREKVLALFGPPEWKPES
jgi:hypothetical protein